MFSEIVVIEDGNFGMVANVCNIAMQMKWQTFRSSLYILYLTFARELYCFTISSF